jgi:two-component system cell cycle sensor histidine kinase/response regulator CckA
MTNDAPQKSPDADKIRQALAASEDRFERFFEEAPLGIALIDGSHIIKDCNGTLATMLGLPVDGVEGKSLDIFINNDTPDAILQTLAHMEQGQPLPPIELQLKGAREPVSVQLHARKFSDGSETVLHFIDLSKQKALEAQFVQSQKMQAIGQLAGGVAHDFNNLLTAMIGFCDLLLLRHKPGDPSFADINQIKQNANRAANLVRQLLAFSRQQTLRPKVQDITDIIVELSHLIRRLIGATIELNVVHGDDLGYVRVDEGQMEQVLINLAVNARDAMPDGGKLTIETRAITTDKPIQRGAETMPPGDYVTISVGDTGTGMPPDVMARIFEPFFTTKPIGQGTGLGLSTVYGIMRQTGGFLHVDSALFKGTTFTLYLPRVAALEHAPAAVTPTESKPQDLTGNARILLVEDEDAVRSFSTRALTNKGYKIVGAASGEEALKIFIEQNSDEKIDLLVTDVVMPNMDGPTLARQIRDKNPTMKIIFMSGYTEERLKDVMGPGIFFLPKPFTLKQLAEKVKEVLESS